MSALSVFAMPGKPGHLCDIGEVRRFYATQTGRNAGRTTVTDWLKRRSIPSFGPNDKQRLFDRAAVQAALAADFPVEPKFITAEDAFLMAGKPYPPDRRRL